MCSTPQHLERFNRHAKSTMNGAGALGKSRHRPSNDALAQYLDASMLARSTAASQPEGGGGGRGGESIIKDLKKNQSILSRRAMACLEIV